METKVCTKCGREWPVHEFCWQKRPNGYRHRRSWCKTCSATYHKKWRWTEEGRPKFKKAHLRFATNYAKRNRANPEFRKMKRALAALNAAVRSGKLKRGSCCVSCCGTPNAQAHHEDYSKPFDVIWLCRYHHTMFHNIKRRVFAS